MYDPLVTDLGHDAFGDLHPMRGIWLVDALERWAADQPEGRRCSARDISDEVARYRKFNSPANHGPIRCARIVATDPRWCRQGAWIVKCGVDAKIKYIAADKIKRDAQMIPASIAVPRWIVATDPGRMSAKLHAEAYNTWAAINNADSCHYTAIARHLVAAGYTIVARPNNRAIYERVDWI